MCMNVHIPGHMDDNSMVLVKIQPFSFDIWTKPIVVTIPPSSVY